MTAPLLEAKHDNNGWMVLYFNGEALGVLAERPQVEYEYHQIGIGMSSRVQQEGELRLRFFEMPPPPPKPRKRVNRVTGLRKPDVPEDTEDFLSKPFPF
ncbi:hypothetical protein SEA_ANON_38 [Gordonia phage Anon]|nr:hypothetical protein SEA_ANON_38 [Gordonia phage Anon]